MDLQYPTRRSQLVCRIQSSVIHALGQHIPRSHLLDLQLVMTIQLQAMAPGPQIMHYAQALRRRQSLILGEAVLTVA